jgi:hypothetical protein
MILQSWRMYGDDRQSSGGSGKRAPEPIVGATGIGLAKLVPTERTGVKIGYQFQSLVPTKIVLMSTRTVNETLEPIQATTRSKKRKIVKPSPVENVEDQVANRDAHWHDYY